jgi:hypothetical protein
MKLIKMFGLAALTAVAAMAFVGASSAMAEPGKTALCKAPELVCSAGNQVKVIHMVAEDSKLLSSLGEVLCETALGLGEVLALGEPSQVIHVTALTWTGCKRSGNSCTVTTTSLGTMTLTNTGSLLGKVVSEGLKVNVKCGIFINCTYGGTVELGAESAEHTEGAGNGMITAENYPVEKLGSGICPSEAKWDALFEPLEATYIES